ncbi:hypothetical protein [Algoriphagus litoralis]|uniref:hypothetical protein n=1 Tax=Algoriphagus litoralis TaxID=2202829 RepID=UPI000DBA1A59|nr:hypothetical protein [Algoriphagus litoralis]
MKKVGKKKFKIDVNVLLGLSAVFLSASALIVSIIQTTIFKEQQRATVWPYMQLTTFFSGDSYSYGLENKGVGPAIIKDFSYTYQGKSFKSTREAFTAIFGAGTKGVGYSAIAKDYVFKSGESIATLTIDLPDSLIQEYISK